MGTDASGEGCRWEKRSPGTISHARLGQQPPTAPEQGAGSAPASKHQVGTQVGKAQCCPWPALHLAAQRGLPPPSPTARAYCLCHSQACSSPPELSKHLPFQSVCLQGSTDG